jgi:hypothetical protein
MCKAEFCFYNAESYILLYLYSCWTAMSALVGTDAERTHSCAYVILFGNIFYTLTATALKFMYEYIHTLCIFRHKCLSGLTTRGFVETLQTIVSIHNLYIYIYVCVCVCVFMYVYIWYDLSTAIGLAPGGSSTVHIYTQTPDGSSTVHIYTQTIHRTTQWNRIHRTEQT